MTPLQAAFPMLHFPFAQDEAIGSSRPCSSDGRFIPKLLALDCLAQVLLFFSFFFFTYCFLQRMMPKGFLQLMQCSFKEIAWNSSKAKWKSIALRWENPPKVVKIAKGSSLSAAEPQRCAYF